MIFQSADLPGGENADLPTDMNAVINATYDLSEEVAGAPDNYNYTRGSYTNNGDYDDFEEGESLLAPGTDME